uniref:Endoplasmic reticulum lectin n=1 Tax=Oryzias sinensis TaxID=183150 RepID=A0A8C7X561_9TELE
EFDWNNETAKASKQHKLRRHHSQTYVNGSKCDLNGNPREAEVRFVCEEGSDDYIARVDEPQSCRYVLTIHTSRTCQHPYLRPPSTAKPQGIVCQPALSAQQYMDYVKAQVSDTKRKVEQISEELKSLDEMLAGNGGTAETLDVKEEVSPELTHDPNQPEEKGLFHSTRLEEKPSTNSATEQLREEEKDEDERLLQEFEDEVADLSVPSEKIDEIKEEMQKEFDDIINEAQQELETEGLKGEFDRTQATQTLETTLDKLLDHLEEKDAPEQQAVQRAGEATGGGPPPLSQAARDTPRLKGTDDHVKIKITKYKTGSSLDGEFKVQEMGEGDPQWQHIKDVVKEQLEKAGLKAEGKIEVKILTRKNVEEADDQWLTEEDTKSFRELLINLLTGGTEEVYKEQKRQQELENNYRFVWGENQEESQSSSTSTDSDDMDV